jgi:hypothetical protein
VKETGEECDGAAGTSGSGSFSWNGCMLSGATCTWSHGPTSCNGLCQLSQTVSCPTDCLPPNTHYSGGTPTYTAGNGSGNLNEMRCPGWGYGCQYSCSSSCYFWSGSSLTGCTPYCTSCNKTDTGKCNDWSNAPCVGPKLHRWQMGACSPAGCSNGAQFTFYDAPEGTIVSPNTWTCP